MANRPNFSFIQTSKGGESLIVDNFRYRIDKQQPIGKRYWKCVVSGYKQTAVTDGNNLVRASSDHCHCCNEVAVERQKFKGDLKDEVSVAIINIFFDYCSCGMFMRPGSKGAKRHGLFVVA